MFEKEQKKYLYIFVIALLMLSATGCNKQNPVSELNKEVTKEDVQARVKQIEKSIVSSQNKKEIPKQIRENIEKQAKESLQREKRIFEIAEVENIKVEDKEIQKRISQIKQTLNKQTKNGFADMLKRQGKTEEQFKEDLFKQLVNQALNKKLSKGVKVTDKEIEAFYNQNKQNFKDPRDAKKSRSLDEMKPLIRQILVSQKINEKLRKMLMKDRK